MIGIGMYLRAAALLGVVALLGLAYYTVKDMGRQQERAASAEAVRKRLNDATLADTDATRCLADARCRLSDDGFKRK